MSLTINGLKAVKNITEKTIEEHTPYEYGYAIIMVDDIKGNATGDFMVHVCTMDTFDRKKFEDELNERLDSFNYSYCSITGRLTSNLKNNYDIVVDLFSKKNLLVDSVYKKRKGDIVDREC